MCHIHLGSSSVVSYHAGSEFACPLAQENHLHTWTLCREPTTCPSSPPPVMSLCKSFSVPSGRLEGSPPAVTLPAFPHLCFVELAILILIGTTKDEGVGYVQSTRGHDVSKGPFFGPG